jgi:hypothetical protein
MVTSNAEAVSELARRISFAVMMILLPEIISRDDPAGTGAFFNRYTPVPPLGSKYKLLLALLPVLLDTKILKIMSVAEPPAVTISNVVAVLDSFVPVVDCTKLDFVLLVNVFAMSA